MTDAILGINTALKLGDGGTPTEIFTRIAEVKSITGPSLAGDTVDVTNMDSVNAFREFIAGLRDGGEITFDINYLFANATHGSITGILQDWAGTSPNKTRNYKITWPDTGQTTWSFAGIITAHDMAAPVDDVITASMTIKITGPTSFS